MEWSWYIIQCDSILTVFLKTHLYQAWVFFFFHTGARTITFPYFSRWNEIWLRVPPCLAERKNCVRDCCPPWRTHSSCLLWIFLFSWGSHGTKKWKRCLSLDHGQCLCPYNSSKYPLLLTRGVVLKVGEEGMLVALELSLGGYGALVLLISKPWWLGFYPQG